MTIHLIFEKVTPPHTLALARLGHLSRHYLSSELHRGTELRGSLQIFTLSRKVLPCRLLLCGIAQYPTSPGRLAKDGTCSLPGGKTDTVVAPAEEKIGTFTIVDQIGALVEVLAFFVAVKWCGRGGQDETADKNESKDRNCGEPHTGEVDVCHPFGVAD